MNQTFSNIVYNEYNTDEKINSKNTLESIRHTHARFKAGNNK